MLSVQSRYNHSNLLLLFSTVQLRQLAVPCEHQKRNDKYCQCIIICAALFTIVILIVDMYFFTYRGFDPSMYDMSYLTNTISFVLILIVQVAYAIVYIQLLTTIRLRYQSINAYLNDVTISVNFISVCPSTLSKSNNSADAIPSLSRIHYLLTDAVANLNKCCSFQVESSFKFDSSLLW